MHTYEGLLLRVVLFVRGRSLRVASSITDRDYTIATVVAPSALKSQDDGTEDEVEVAEGEEAEGEETEGEGEEEKSED